MKRKEPVSAIMSTDIISTHPDQKPSVARHLLVQNKIQHLPVVEGHKLIGLISSLDMMRVTISAYGMDEKTTDAFLDREHTIRSIMTKALVTLSKDDTIKQAAEILDGSSFHSLPVIDAEQNLLGIVTSTDIIRYLLKQFEPRKGKSDHAYVE